METRKLLTANDVGLTGTHQSGIHIPKSNPELFQFFPTLDPRDSNPRVDINVFIPELNRHATLKFIYYNNKLTAGGTRNEFRLTGLTSIFRDLNPTPGDCLVLTYGCGDELVLTLDRWGPNPELGRRQDLQVKGWTVTRESGRERPTRRSES